MNDTDRVTSDHLLHGSTETRDIDVEFAAEMRAVREGWFINPIVILPAAMEQAAAMVDAYHASGLSAETKALIDTTAQIMREAEPIEY